MAETNSENAFYFERGLPEPEREYRPGDLEGLRKLVEGREPDRPAVILGGGEHLRSRVVEERPFDVIRTSGCEGIRALDLESNVVRVRAGTTWGNLRRALRERGRTLSLYGLYPADATVGGLLARHQPLEKQLFTGDIREGCIALTATAPESGDYEYLPAPRKASGPDHRFLHIGGEGFGGVILEATLVVWPERAAWLFEHPAERFGEARELYREIIDQDIRLSWCRWSSESGTFRAAIYGPDDVLRSYERRLESATGTSAAMRKEGSVGEVRRELERDHPGARSGGRAERTVRVAWNLDEIDDRIESLGYDLEDVVVDQWSRRRAEVYLVASSPEPGWNPEREPFTRALAYREIVDGGRAEWSEWTRRLKGRLDPEGALAVGPRPSRN
jgi:hypothetical protein